MIPAFSTVLPVGKLKSRIPEVDPPTVPRLTLVTVRPPLPTLTPIADEAVTTPALR
jgi:hypothetical protein